MHTPALPPRTRPGSTALFVAAVLLAGVPARAESIIFKDGFTLTGHVIRQKKTIVDPVSNTPIELQDGFFLVDDGARAIIFSPAHLQDVQGEYKPPEIVKKYVIAADTAGTEALPAV